MKGNKARCPAEWGRASLANLPKERRYLIGVSGGRDSIVLLHWLLAQGYRRLIVCHFEHGLRGRAGKTDARFVERLAQKHALEFELGSADIAAIAQQAKRSIETTARRERLVFFQRTGRRRRCLTIFLGHHADDQVETFLLNLFRGAAGRGLGAMRERSRYEALEMARPLLGVWRSEIDGYVAQHRLKFREDATNAELGARRNRTRHLIVPWLEKQFGRNLRATIWRSAQVLAEEDACLAGMIPSGLTKAEELSVSAIRALPLALQRRVLQQWLQHHEVAGVDFASVEKVRRLLQGSIPAKVNLARDCHARRRAGKVFLERPAE